MRTNEGDEMRNREESGREEETEVVSGERGWRRRPQADSKPDTEKGSSS